ncbi:MAG TPA: PEP-CTERM sorting domain-containing protein [Tepidisphaeraceae bacterium]|nr:PEP-CTERM sorting domain-containing protein [Tepidisphaeraceae bacterium]
MLLTVSTVACIALPRAALADYPVPAGVELYGTEDVLNSGATYASDPTAGATLIGLAPGVVTAASLVTPHSFPFTPTAGDFPGTDQIYVGSVQTGADDGYSSTAQRLNGPDVLALDYSALVPAGQTISSFTLGIALDDFQFPVFGQPFTVSLNGVPNSDLTSLVETPNETGPVVQFYSIGLDPSLLLPSNVATLSIDEGGNGGDGYAIDYLTVGVTTVPEPMSAGALAAGGACLLMRRRRSATN